MTRSESRWPGGRRAAISITIDNMGEAAELYRGTWPEEKPVGNHSSVTELLPMMLRTLEQFGVRATYFIEGLNTEMYPGAIESVRNAGHEVAFHGWQHEPWSQLDPETERELFQKGVNGFARLEIRLSGFRPPGGVLTPSTASLLREFGFQHCSPAGADAVIHDDIVYLPFDWKGIDAYYYSIGFGGLRQAKGDTSDPLSPDAFRDRAIELIEQRVDSGGYTALLFHPFLENDPERIAAMTEIIRRVVDDERIWCAPGCDIAAWIKDHLAEFGTEPQLDTTTWSR